MTFGSGIFLLALGAILSFAVGDTKVGPLDLSVIGYILMGAGVLGIILGATVLRANRRPLSSTTRRTVSDGTRPPQEEIIENDVR